MLDTTSHLRLALCREVVQTVSAEQDPVLKHWLGETLTVRPFETTDDADLVEMAWSVVGPERVQVLIARESDAHYTLRATLLCPECSDVGLVETVSAEGLMAWRRCYRCNPGERTDAPSTTSAPEGF